MFNIDSNNKNIWLAVCLAIITSLTSLGTAFITKDTSDVDDISKKVKVLEEDFKNLEKVNQKLHGAIILIKDKIDSCKCY
tara:strand:- start:1676 stop:1915 length:240 start_codon:yes stop_codon:yes gene_type:complete